MEALKHVKKLHRSAVAKARSCTAKSKDRKKALLDQKRTVCARGGSGAQGGCRFKGVSCANAAVTTVRGFLAQATRVEANESTIQNSGSFVDFLQTEKHKAVDPSLRSASKRRVLAALQAQPPVSIRPGKAAWSTPSGRSS